MSFFKVDGNTKWHILQKENVLFDKEWAELEYKVISIYFILVYLVIYSYVASLKKYSH